MTSDWSPWFLRANSYSEPNGDYTANCYLNLKSAVSEDSITFNDASCHANSNAYYCQTADIKKEEPVKEVEEPEPEDAAAAPPSEKTVIPWPEAGGEYKSFICEGGSYTGKHEKCGHIEGVTESECWKKCQDDAHAGGSEECDKKTGVPDCVAMVYDISRKACILHRECTKLMPVPPDVLTVVKIKDTYHPNATRFEKLMDRRCDGESYTRPDDEKEGFKDVSAEECKEACFSNKWPGSEDVEVKKCFAASYYVKKRYCDLYSEDECEETKKKPGYITFKKIPPEEQGPDELDSNAAEFLRYEKRLKKER